MPDIGGYEILELVGVGGMAEAFRARARGPGGHQRELIIKQILPHLAEDAEFIRGFVDEAKILGMIDHPNVVRVYDFGLHGERHFLALEYLDGPTMAEILATVRRRGGQIPLPIALHLVREVCRGLQAVHGLTDASGLPLKVIHRDVTPSNIMTTRRGGVKLLDFGVAKIGAEGQRTRQGQIKGKVGYLSPEQIKGDPIDARVDLFALGVVLHELLCLEPLFYGEGGDLAALYRIMEMPIPAPSSRRRDVPPALDALVLRALARAPAERHASAAELGDGLEAILAGMTAPDLPGFLTTIG
jgi:serine/threonine-protein kinase